MFALNALIDRLTTARLVVRGLALVKELGPYAAVELLLPGGSLIAIGLWLYARRRSGKPLLPFKVRFARRRTLTLSVPDGALSCPSGSL